MTMAERSIRESNFEDRVKKKRNSASGGTAVRTAPLPESSVFAVLPLEPSLLSWMEVPPGRRVGRPMAAEAAAASVWE